MDLVNTYTNVGQTDIDNLELTADYQRRGYHQLTLTEMDTTTIPQVAAGSMVEVGGALYEADTAESISGSASSGTNYIYLVPGSSIVTPTWTTTAPTWSDAKQGWYGTSGSASYRYIEWSIDYDGATSYDIKRPLTKEYFEKTLIVVGISTSYASPTAITSINFDKKVYDRNNEFNLSLDTFTPIKTGFYKIELGLIYDFSTSTFLQISAGASKGALPTNVLDTAIICQSYAKSQHVDAQQLVESHVSTSSSFVYLTPSNTVYFFVQSNSANVTISGDSTFFNGSLLKIEQIG